MKKETLKSKVLKFVFENGNKATYTEIIRFIVDLKFGEGTYDNGKGQSEVYRYNKKTKEVVTTKANYWRGYFACGLTIGSRWTKRGYLLTGPTYLEKIEIKDPCTGKIKKWYRVPHSYMVK
jgi:hypothetical protein